jgi:hypothetical protein
VVEIFTGTSATNLAWLNNGASGMKPVYLRGGKTLFETTMKLQTLSDGTQTYGTMCGIVDGVTGTNGTVAANGIYFTYTNGENGGNLYAHCSAASSHTHLDLGVAPSTATYVRVGWVANAAWTSIQWYVNRVAVGSPMTTNIVAAATALRFMWAIQKSAGTTSRSLLIDRYRFAVKLS